MISNPFITILSLTINPHTYTMANLQHNCQTLPGAVLGKHVSCVPRACSSPCPAHPAEGRQQQLQVLPHRVLHQDQVCTDEGAGALPGLGLGRQRGRSQQACEGARSEGRAGRDMRQGGAGTQDRSCKGGLSWPEHRGQMCCGERDRRQKTK